MNLKTKYAYAKQDNGNYVIFHVPFFRPFTRTINTPEGKKTITCDLWGVQDVLKRLKKIEAQGSYLRAFIGHHNGSYQNQEGLGFLDNTHLEGDTLFCDVVQISPEQIEKIKNNWKYPYFSPEYDYKEQILTGLAFLESQEPYFIFPMLVLEDQETIPDQQIKFQLNNSVENIIRYCGGDCDCKKGDKMDGFEKDDEKDKDLKTMPTSDDSTAKMKCALEADGGKLDQVLQAIQSQGEMIKKMADALGKLFETEEKEHGEGLDGEKQPAQSEENSSVAYQRLSASIDGMSKKIRNLEGKLMFSATENRLREVCEENGLDYDFNLQTLAKFQDENSKNVFIESLANSRVGFSRHRASEALDGMKDQPINQKEKIIAKFKDAKERAIAKQAFINYQDSANQLNERAAMAFQNMHPSIEKFVEYCVEQERETPGFMQRMTS